MIFERIRAEPEVIRETCPHCNSGASELRLHGTDFDGCGESFDVVACRGCGLLRTSPFPASTELDRWYGPDYYGQGEGKFLPGLERLLEGVTRRRARSLLRRVSVPTDRAVRALDIGCGRGLLLGALSELGADCHGLERDGFDFPDPPAGVTMHCGGLEALPFHSASCDLITLWHVLEHLERPGPMLERLSALLAPGGVIAISVPNIDSLQARVFGADWFHLDLPRHLWHFSPETLGLLSAGAGLRVVQVSRFSAEQDLFGFVQSLLNRFISGPPNRLYRAIRGEDVGSRTGWLVLAALLAPLAVLESLLAVSVARGATYTVYLRKADSCCTENA